MAIRAVIFNTRGVLLQHTNLSGLKNWEKRLGLRQGMLLRLIDGSGLINRTTEGETSEGDGWQRLGKRLDLDETQLRTLENDYWASYTLNTELADFLQSLHPQYKRVILTASWQDTRESLAQRFGLDKVVDTMIFAQDLGLARSEIKLYQLAPFRVQVEAEEILYLDDGYAGVDAAQLVGMRGIRYRSNEQALTEMRKYLVENSKM